MTATGLAATPEEYRRRLDEQSDQQIDDWVAELMRDVSIRRGVRQVLADFRRAARVDDALLERLYARGGGPPAAIGRTTDGELMVPAISLHYLVTGARVQFSDARQRLTDYIVDNFHEIVFV